MLAPIVAATGVPGYDSIAQHISEVALLDHPLAWVQRIAAAVTGVSILLFGLGALLWTPRRLGFTAFAAWAFGASMLSNGVFVMGSPLHGLYGLGLFMVLVPACFAAELPDNGNRAVKTWSLLVSTFSMIYMWLMLSGFDPPGFRGITQRVATLVIFGWYSMAGYWLIVRAKPNHGLR